MGYTTYDFSESLDRVSIDVADVESVLAAWGDGPGGSEWSGGFLLKMKSSPPFAYVTGWCDYTGWGCQDGAEIHTFLELPDRSTLPGPYDGTFISPDAAWDEEPADLNRYVRGEITRRDVAV